MIPDLDHLKRAYAVTSRATQLTPLLESAALARETGAARVFVKPESLQWAGSFKVRGAYWRLKQLSADEAKRGVVAYSSGNFAQGLAAAGQALGVPVTIVMPIDAPAAKREATAGYGATVVLTDHGDRAREEVASERARQISAEQDLCCCTRSTIRRSSPARPASGSKRWTSLPRKGARADVVFCPVGGGGLIGGVALAFHYLSPDTSRLCGRAGRLQRHGHIDRGWRDRDHAAGPEIDLRRPDGAPAGRGAVRRRQAAGVRGMTVSDAAVRRAMKIAAEQHEAGAGAFRRGLARRGSRRRRRLTARPWWSSPAAATSRSPIS